MTARADIVATIREVIATKTEARDIPPAALLSLHGVDSIDEAEIAIDLEEKLDLPMGSIEPVAGWTVDMIADAVMAARVPVKPGA